MASRVLPPSAQLKLDLLFEGIRYREVLRRAGEHSFPNDFPHRRAPDEPDPAGTGTATVPDILQTEGDTRACIRRKRISPWGCGVSARKGIGYNAMEARRASGSISSRFSPG